MKEMRQQALRNGGRKVVSGWVWDQGVITHQTMPAGPGTLLSRGLGGTKKTTQSLALESQSLVGEKP